MADPSHKIQDYLITASEIGITWDDNHQSFYALEPIRRACPCAKCSGEGFGPNRVEGNPGTYTESSFQLSQYEQVGHYGIRLMWKDGHNTGIHNLKELRASCSCEKCKS